MGNQVWRPDQLPEERTARLNRNLFPDGLEGMSPNTVPVLGSGTDQAAAIRGNSESGGTATPQWVDEYLVVASAPTTWTLEQTPYPSSLDLKLNDVGQVADVDYTLDGNIVTFTNPTDLFKGLVSGDPWTLTAQYQCYQTATPDTQGDIFAFYHPSSCPGSENWFGDDGWGPFGPVTSYRPSGSDPVSLGGNPRVVLSGMTFGAVGPQTITVAPITDNTSSTFVRWKPISFWRSTDGCVAMVDHGEGYLYLTSASGYTYTIPISGPSGYPYLLRVQGLIGAGSSGPFHINFDAGSP